MKRAENLIATLGPKGSGLHLAEDGYRNAQGYPVTPEGRPDWCATCAKLETFHKARSPNRVAREIRTETIDEREVQIVVTLGLCTACGRRETETRQTARAKVGQPVAKAGGWR